MIRAGLALICLNVFAAGCGDDANAPKKPSACDPSTQWEGAYFVTYETVSGNCGPIPSQIERISQEPTSGGACSLLADDVRSANLCKLERSVRCPLEGGYTQDTNIIVEQQDEVGALLTGMATFTMRYTVDGGVACKGTYRMTAKRQ